RFAWHIPTGRRHGLPPAPAIPRTAIPRRAPGSSWLTSAGGPPSVSTGEELLESDRPHASPAAQRGLGHDGPAANPVREPGPHRALRVEPREGAAHERAPAVV